jgi:hypothetical protein
MAGAWTLTLIGNDGARRIIPWMLLAVVIYVALSPRLGAQATKARVDATLFGWTFGLSLGFYDGFFGPGTGAFWILGLVTLLGQELTRANAFTKVVNLASNLGSLLVFAVHGQVAPWVALAMIAGQAHQRPPRVRARAQARRRTHPRRLHRGRARAGAETPLAGLRDRRPRGGFGSDRALALRAGATPAAPR